MERLTYWNKEMLCWSYRVPNGEVAMRLAAYENTGLEPDKIETAKERIDIKFSIWVSNVWELADGRLNEILKAEKDGRLVVLPCKPGQMVWAESPVRGKTYSFEAPGIAWIIENTERFGKEIFLTREEADAALKKREENNETD